MKNKVGKLSFHLLTTTSCRSYRGLSCWQLYYSGHYASSSNTITSVRQIGSLGIRTSGDIEPYKKIMTRRTTRNSASSLSSAAEVADEKPAVSTKAAAAKTKKKTVPKKKSSKATKASPKREPKVVISSQEEGDEIDSPPTNDGPWFHIFTKGDEEYDRYMATEWGFEKRGTVPLFEKMTLEGAQSGLSWLTILRKREAYRRVFYNFDVDKVAAMTTEDVERILAEDDKKNTRNIIVRHRGKIESTISNAQCIQRLLGENPQNPDYLDEFLWSFVNDKPILNTSWNGTSLNDIAAQTKESHAMSKALKSLGFRFVGPTTMYALMQSCGMVIDHPLDSPEWNAARDRLKERPGGFQEQGSWSTTNNESR